MVKVAPAGEAGATSFEGAFSSCRFVATQAP